MAELNLLLEIRDYFLSRIAAEVEDMLSTKDPRRDLGFANDEIFNSYWEEYCVQEQLEEGDYFEVYEKTIKEFALYTINKLPIEIQKLLLYIGRLDFQKKEIYESEEQVLNHSNNYNCDLVKKIIEKKAVKFRNASIEKYENLDLPDENDE